MEPPAAKPASPADAQKSASEARLRQQYLIRITKRLVTLTGITLIFLGIFCYLVSSTRTFLVLYVFLAGLIGGFVSIQQRLPRIDIDELRELSGSWLSVILIPVNGGIFAVVLHLMFLGEIVQGSLFPEYSHPEIDKTKVLASFQGWMTDAFPSSGPDIAKLFFWSFVAGFSERFVPQIIQKTTKEAEAEPAKPSEPPESSD